MAADYLVISRVNRPNLGGMLVRAANLQKELRELIAGINAATQRQWASGDYTKLVAQTGCDPADAANMLTLIGLVNTIYNTNSDVVGSTRLSQLDEFQARLAGQ